MIDLVVADPEVGRRCSVGSGLELGVVDLLRGLPVKGPVRTLGVVVRRELIELGLEGLERYRGRLLGQVLLLGLVESLDLATGLGVVWPGVLGPDAGRAGCDRR